MGKFTKKIAREIAYKEFLYLLDSIIGNNNYRFNLGDDIQFFIDYFEEELLERGFQITTYRINLIKNYFNKFRIDTIKLITKKHKEVYIKHYDKSR